jgi:hypothetical protein
MQFFRFNALVEPIGSRSVARSKPWLEHGHEPRVDLDGDDVRTARKERAGQLAGPRPNLEHKRAPPAAVCAVLGGAAAVAGANMPSSKFLPGIPGPAWLAATTAIAAIAATTAVSDPCAAHDFVTCRRIKQKGLRQGWVGTRQPEARREQPLRAHRPQFLKIQQLGYFWQWQ